LREPPPVELTIYERSAGMQKATDAVAFCFCLYFQSSEWSGYKWHLFEVVSEIGLQLHSPLPNEPNRGAIAKA
jgi:hypothetical protein